MPSTNDPIEIHSESDLQLAIYDDPTILHQAWQDDDPPRWVFIRREKDVPVDSIKEHNLLLDFLLVDAEARPTLVEAKISSDMRIRRTVVGQLLEYAAYAEDWDVGELKDDYDNPVDTRLRVLAKIPSPEIYVKTDDFWQRLCENLKNKCMTLVFAADDFPEETQKVAEFLDTVTKDDLSVRIYAPSDINHSSERPRGPGRRRLATRSVQPDPVDTASFENSSDEWTRSYKIKEMRDRLSGQIAPEEMLAVDHLCRSAQAAGAQIQKTKWSLKIQVPTASGSPVSIAWLCLPDSPWQAQGTAAVFGLHFKSDKTRRTGQVGELLKVWTGNFESCVFAKRPPSPNWKPGENEIPSDRWQVEYSDLPDNLKTIEGWMIDVITKLRDA